MCRSRSSIFGHACQPEHVLDINAVGTLSWEHRSVTALAWARSNVVRAVNSILRSECWPRFQADPVARHISGVRNCPLTATLLSFEL